MVTDLDAVAVEPDPMRLARNLAALERRQPELAEILRGASFAHTTAAGSGEPTCQVEVDGQLRWLHSAYAPGNEAEQQSDHLDPTMPVALVGAGLGYLVHALLRRGAPDVLVLEPDASMLKTTLGLFALDDAIDDGRLRLCHDERRDHRSLDPLPAQTFVHPALTDLYGDRLRRARFEARRPGARGRVLMVDGKLFVADLTRLLEEDGWAVRVVQARELGVARFDALVAEVAPRFLFSINFSPELAFLATRRNLPYLSWTIDPLPASRLRLLPETDPMRCVAFAHRRAIVEMLRAAGLARTDFLPLAASPTRRPAEGDLSAYRCPVSFVGSSLAVENRGLHRRLADLGADEGLRTRIDGWLDQTFTDRGLDLSFAGIDPADLPPWWREAMPDADPIELADRANGALSYRLRLARVRALDGICVYGDDGWEPLGARYRGRAHHGDELTAIYTASGANLDVPRIYQRDIVTMRVFDVMRCRGVVLAERSDALKELFDDAHLVTYEHDDEMRRQVQRLRDDPSLGPAIGEAARRHVEAHHTMRKRLTALLSALPPSAR